MRLLFVACIKYILIVILWQALEMVFYRAVQHRIVDDIIGLILLWYIYQSEKKLFIRKQAQEKGGQGS